MKHAIAIFLVWCVLGHCGFAQEEKRPDAVKAKIEGFVLSSDGRPIGGVEVSAWVVGDKRPIASARTDGKLGAYGFEVNAASSIDILYVMSRYEPSVVTQLAHNKAQVISKVMYRRGEELSASAAHEYMASIDRIAFLAVSLPDDDRGSFLSVIEKKIGGPLFAPLDKDGMMMSKKVDNQMRTYLLEEAKHLSQKVRMLGRMR